jgi:hypothetical protein
LRSARSTDYVAGWALTYMSSPAKAGDPVTT